MNPAIPVTLIALLQATTPSPADQLGSYSDDIFNAIKFLFALAGVLLLAVVAVKYWIPKFAGVQTNNAGPIKVVARFGLEPRKTLYIIQTGNDYYLIGTSESDMYYLTALDPASVEPFLTAPVNQEAGPAFAEILRKFSGRPAKGPGQEK